MLFNSPLSIQKADQIIDDLPLSPQDIVVDIGCGTGEFLIRLVERKGVHGLGIDQDAESIYLAKKAASDRIQESTCDFKQATAQDLALHESSFGLAICIGSTQAYGTGEAAFPNTLREFSRIVKAGGLLLVGEGYWKQEPATEYLELIGTPVGIYRDHKENISFAEEQGLVTLGAFVRSDDEWDQFEWSHQQRIEREFAASTESASLAQKLKRRREWMRGYLRWGRATMGFGFCLFQKPAQGHGKSPEAAATSAAPQR